MSKYFKINFTVENNFYSLPGSEYPVYLATLTLTNIGSDVIKPASWEMYGCIFMLVEPEYYPYSSGFHILSCGLRVFHINGNLYRFQPIGNAFPEMGGNSVVKCNIKIGHYQMSKTDSMPRWFFTADNIQPKVIENTNDESLSFVSEFKYPYQYQSSRYRHSKPFTPQDRYRMYKRPSVTVPQMSIVPTPLLVKTESSFKMDFEPQHFSIVQSPVFQNEIQYLSGKSNDKTLHIFDS